MRLRWTVVDGAATRPAARHVVVRCPRGTALGAVLDLITDGSTEVDGPPGGARVAGRQLLRDAVVGVPPLLDGAVVELGAPPGPTAPPALLELAVTGGPDAGAVLALPRRRMTLGRAAGNDVRLQDPRLSRHHCTLTVSADGVHVEDAGSTNGASADAGGPLVLGLGARWRVGASTVRLRAAADLHAHRGPGRAPTGGAVTVTDRGDGTRELRPPPRVRTPEPATELRLPAPARAGRAGAFPLLAVVLPALAAGGLAWWTGSVVYLALAALGPLLVVGSWWTARRDARRDGALGRRAHARACSDVQEQARTAAVALAAARARAMPDAVALLEACTGPSVPLWERHHHDGDALRVRLGLAVVDDHGPAPGADRAGLAGPDLVGHVTVLDREGRAELVRTEEDLLALDLRDGPVGVVHTAGSDPSQARFLVGQLVGLLAPASLVVVPVVGRAVEPLWAWLRLLPHVAPHHQQPGAGAVSALHDALAAVGARRGRPSGPRDPSTPAPPVLVVVHDPDGELDGADLERLSGAEHVGVHVLVVAADGERLPRICAQVVAPASPDGVQGRLVRLADGACAVAVLDRVPARWSSRLARALAPLRLAAPDEGGGLPPAVALEDLLDLRPGAVALRWASPPDGLPVPLGSGAQGPVTVDLTTAGPHALVAGTTGAGKSELLRSWVLSLVATQPPDRLALLLVDYKGGATFDELAVLPHCVGLLTDLDGGASARVLRSLQAEVHRRERLLAAAGARDLRAYRALPGGGPEPVPRLLVVVDEFRVLAEDAPHVLGQFVRLAATGPSLGIHLVLATQRSGGVVSADIRANAALRIALRVQDPAESRDVVDRPDAAWLPSSAPGRAVVVGAGVDVVVQTAWTGGAQAGPLVSVVPAGEDSRTGPTGGVGSGGPPGGHSPAPPPSPSGAPAVVAAVLEAARLRGAGPARRPWLPPLPAVVPALDGLDRLDGLDGLDRLDRPEGLDEPGGTDRPGAPGPRAASPEGLLLAVADVPRAQARRPVTWAPLRDGPLLVLGAARSGRSTTLGTVSSAAARAGLPVVRLCAAAGTEDHVLDVLAALCSPPTPPPGPVERGDATDDWSPDGRTGTPPRDVGPAEPRLLLLVDDVDELLDPGAEPAAAELLLRLVRSGHRDGIGVALAGGRALAASRVAGAARARLVHRTVDRADAVVAGVPPTTPPAAALPGRCHVVGLEHGARGGPGGTGGHEGEALEAQVLLGDDPSGTVALPAWVPSPLPRELLVEDLPSPGTTSLPLAQDGSGLPWSLDLGPGGLVVVAGPPGSGRTTTLRAVRVQAAASGAVTRCTTDDGDGSAGRPTGPPTWEVPAVRTAAVDVLLVDDVDRLDDARLAPLEQWLQSRSGPLAGVLSPGATVVVAGATAWFADSFRGLPALARQAGRGLVLQPGRTDVRDVLGLRGAPVQLQQHPGRALLVERGRARRVQVARPRTSAPATSPRPIPSGVTPSGGPPA